MMMVVMMIKYQLVSSAAAELLFRLPSVSEVVQTLQLCTDRDQLDVVGDLSVCLDGMTVDPETFATAEANHQGESPLQRRFWTSLETLELLTET